MGMLLVHRPFFWANWNWLQWLRLEGFSDYDLQGNIEDATLMDSLSLRGTDLWAIVGGFREVFLVFPPTPHQGYPQKGHMDAHVPGHVPGLPISAFVFLESSFGCHGGFVP